jgi:hypothetical protein
MIVLNLLKGDEFLKRLTILGCVALFSVALLIGSTNSRAAADVRVVSSQDETFTHSGAGVQFQLPKGWKAKPDGEIIAVSSADEAFQVLLWVPDEDTFDAAVKELDKELGKTIKNIKTTGKPTQDTHNGMAHYGENGTGVVEGTTIEWSVDVLGAKKPLIILTFAAPNQVEKNADGYLKLVNSIKKL